MCVLTNIINVWSHAPLFTLQINNFFILSTKTSTFNSPFCFIPRLVFSIFAPI